MLTEVLEDSSLHLEEQSSLPVIHIGMATCGLASGAKALHELILKEVASRNLAVKVVPTGCIGMCHNEPLVDITMPGKNRVSYRNVKPNTLTQILDAHFNKNEFAKKYAVCQISIPGAEAFAGLPMMQEIPFFKGQVKIVSKRCGMIDPLSIDDYIAMDGYKALKKVLSSMTPEQVIDEVTKSGLRGRGGGGFPTGMKWNLTRKSPGPEKYVVCNADEGDPGAFMDRSVLEGDPHSVIEGMILASFAVGHAKKGYIYCRAEYPLAIKRLQKAINDARERNFLGENILGSDLSFDLEIKEGAGAYVCGEETALLASLMGERGMPWPKPPFPAQKGVWGKPSVINNVETLANIGHIILGGGDWYASYGSEKTKGTKTFALTGSIKNTGLIEVPAGTPLREIVFSIGGGMVEKKIPFKAAQLGGPSGGCIPTSGLDTPVDFENVVSAGAIMGSGGIVIMDEAACIVDTAKFFLKFTQDESCGECTPCRVGSKIMLDILTRITEGKGQEGDLDELVRLSMYIKSNSLCGLGGAAPNPVLSTIRYFRDEYEAHIRDKRCPGTVCNDLIKYVVIEEDCTTCGLCEPVCPSGSVTWEKGEVAHIDLTTCIRCKACVDACKFRAII
ncbi:NADH-quinone oxidoreductase subunit NuoF [Leptospirillum ferrooxidans]|jgi:NADH-quinone oxidoreductase subunit F|uniref:NADH dehydrogenase, subunit F n=1 Tax=Leptospirillum ferrooxidans (strain C2-3) TaxID=1162668 RepID=I0IQ26_LEPFC|nr:NADH dehydrogenase, subunit F [Leptospirillum ferrooxidans C2-3]